jgi:DNA-binding Lrp family transcriptional regulator
VPLELDRTDRAILRALQRDASVSNVALAAKVNLSAPACLRRVERLKAAGLIKGIVALLDADALDLGMLVMIGVVLDRSTPDSFADFEKAAQKVSGCLECHVVTGEFDYFMLVRTRDNDSFNRSLIPARYFPWHSSRCANCWTMPPPTATAFRPSTSTTSNRSRPSWRPPRKPARRSSCRPAPVPASTPAKPSSST